MRVDEIERNVLEWHEEGTYRINQQGDVMRLEFYAEESVWPQPWMVLTWTADDTMRRLQA